MICSGIQISTDSLALVGGTRKCFQHKDDEIIIPGLIQKKKIAPRLIRKSLSVRVEKHRLGLWPTNDHTPSLFSNTNNEISSLT